MSIKTMMSFIVGSLLLLTFHLSIPDTSHGQGSFEFTRTDIPTGRRARGLTVGDFNGDGNQDVVSMNERDNNMTVLLGNGAGGFSSATNFSLGEQPRAVTLFGHGPSPSLAIAHRGDDTVWIVPPDGQGGFRVDQATILTAGNDAAAPDPDGPTAIVTADFNNDGWPDLATAEIDGDTVTVFLNNGDGTFDVRSTSLRIAGTPAEMDADPRSIAAADFNGDGNLDIVTANHDSGTIAVLLGDGAGNFAVQIRPEGNNPVVAVAADLDGDGTQDVVVTDRTVGTLIVLLGNGDGGFLFGDEITVDPGGRPEASTMVDFDGDGHQDVVVASRDGNKVFIMLGDGVGGFGMAAQADVGAAPRAVAVADLNNDGKSDIVVANSDGGTVTILLQN